MRVPALFLPCALALAACQVPAPPAPPGPPPAPEIVTYDVPPAEAHQVARLLQSALGDGARAMAGPAGKVVVVAPAAMQAGVGSLVNELSASPSAQHDVELVYWVLSGVPGEGGAALPEALSGVEAEIRTHHGPMALEVLETRRLRAVSGERASSSTRTLKIQQRAVVQPVGQAIVAEIEMTGDAHVGLTTQVRLQPGQQVVLAELGGRPGASDGEVVYYVVQGHVIGG